MSVYRMYTYSFDRQEETNFDSFNHPDLDTYTDLYCT